MSSSTWTFGPGGIYTAVWDGVDTLTVTLTATGAFVESFSGQSLPLLLPNLLQFPQTPALASFISGQFLCPPVQYAPGTQTSLTTTAQAFAAVASANVNTGNFPVPQSGSVLVTASFVSEPSASADSVAYGLCAHGTSTPMVGFSVQEKMPATTQPYAHVVQFLVTGLTPGTVTNLDLMWCIQTTGTATILAFGQTATSPTLGNSGAGAPVVMTVQAI